ncbi:hypothetical protein ENUP19_0167G0018 [Entamoeba nuttalli]|uniref:Uncharacterized protein n=1 Tax=Entamoeba nuttalli TaxID=412467 RepID=A0ABQ0DM78_9EUKA
MLLGYLFKYIEKYPSLLSLLKEKDICDNINISLKESADLKVEYISKMGNDLWPIPLHRGSGEFMMMLNEAVKLLFKRQEHSQMKLIVSYVFEMQKVAVLVIVEDIDRLLEEEHYSTFNEAVESSIYLRKRKDEIQFILTSIIIQLLSTEKINE